MASIGSTLLSTFTPKALTPKVTNFIMVNSGFEYSHSFETNVQRFQIKTRGKSNLKFCFISGDTISNYISLPGKAVYFEDSILVQTLTIYFQTDVSGDILEILEWF